MALFSVLAVQERLAGDVNLVLERLAQACQLTNREALFARQSSAVLATFRNNYDSWTTHRFVDDEGTEKKAHSLWVSSL